MEFSGLIEVAVLREVYKSRKKKHQMACEWKGKKFLAVLRFVGYLKI